MSAINLANCLRKGRREKGGKDDRLVYAKDDTSSRPIMLIANSFILLKTTELSKRINQIVIDSFN